MIRTRHFLVSNVSLTLSYLVLWTGSLWGEEPGLVGDRFDLLEAVKSTINAKSPLAAALNVSPVKARDDSENDDADRKGEDEGGIKDNSFLIEEAYNQEAGVVQHIFNWVPGWDWTDGHSRTFDFVFTQEWPIGSETHQFSYTIPVSSMFSHPQGGTSSDESGAGDVLLNYRYQLSKESPRCPAITPRFSLILPTGDESQGLGNGEVGYQFNLPISKQVGDWAHHFNAGLTVTPDVNVDLGPGVPSHHRTLHGYNLGTSAIWLARKDLNFMLEAVATWNEEFTDIVSIDHTFEVLLSPGVRWAPYTKGETQWVLGVGLPIGLTRDAPDISLFLYMSFEHPFKEIEKNSK